MRDRVKYCRKKLADAEGALSQKSWQEQKMYVSWEVIRRRACAHHKRKASTRRACAYHKERLAHAEYAPTTKEKLARAEEAPDAKHRVYQVYQVCQV